MYQEFSYIDRAYKKLEFLCITKFDDKYPDNRNSFEAYSIMEKELSYIKNQGSAPLILCAYEAITVLEAKSEMFCLRGQICGSVVFHVLGLTEIEPTSVSPKVYPEFSFGIDGKRKFSIDMFVTNNLYKKLVRYFENYNGEERLRHHHKLDGKLFGVRISDPQISIGIYDKREFHFDFIKIKSFKTLKKNIMTGEVFEIIKPQTTEDQVKCMSFNCWKELWKDNSEEYFNRNMAPFSDLIASIEDIYEFLMDHGIDKTTAYKFADDISFGEIHSHGWNPEILDLLNKAQIPKWYMESCEKIICIGSRVHFTNLFNHFRLHKC